MSSTAPQAIARRDYRPPDWHITQVELDVALHERADGMQADVHARLAVERRPGAPAEAPLELDGEELETLTVQVDGRAHPYRLTPARLILADLPEHFVLETRVRIRPDDNTRLSGFYRSQDGYFTQCEAEGFRRITWFLDRPDVMAVYTVTLHADATRFPVLLANGNPVAAGPEAGGRHFATWHDPFKKPSYLFAMVAARLEVLRDTFRTASGRSVALAIHVEPGKLDQCGHAMAALKKAMRWDEERFGLECDLDHYMIVAVGDFNMGAMENKGLNIFNTKYVLARPDIATDSDFENIDRVVAHEYFHNWTGNRVTCRDWFQLSLKEGLTVFRDQEFGADVHDARTARIREVRTLRAVQFPEDAGPMAHPVRPESYIEINNFYTATVYEKGAEVVRMLQTLIGRDAFRAGMDEYFRRHDGQAVTCDDFIAAMAAHAPAGSGFDAEHFLRWYSQPGTPRLICQATYDAAARSYHLDIRQENPKAEALLGAAPPLLMPIRVVLLRADGSEIPGTARTLVLREARQTFDFTNIDAPPVPSLLRDFSAPVRLDFSYPRTALASLLAHESDPFSAWEAGQRLASDILLSATAELAAGRPAHYPDDLGEALGRLLARPETRGHGFVAEALGLPGESTLAESLEVVDPDALHAARNGLRRHLARQLADLFAQTYAALAPRGAYRPDPADAGRRALRNVCLAYLLENDTPSARKTALAQFENADNMTDRFAALAALAQVDADPCPERTRALADFYAAWQHEPLVVDKWLAVQAASRRADTLIAVRRLTTHPAFDAGNPNKVYALLRTFGANFVRFHAADGSGYDFLAEWIRRLDGRNPQIAARLARCFDRWRKFDAGRQAKARAVLDALRRQPGLSRDVYEVVSRALAD